MRNFPDKIPNQERLNTEWHRLRPRRETFLASERSRVLRLACIEPLAQLRALVNNRDIGGNPDARGKVSAILEHWEGVLRGLGVTPNLHAGEGLKNDQDLKKWVEPVFLAEFVAGQVLALITEKIILDSRQLSTAREFSEVKADDEQGELEAHLLDPSKMPNQLKDYFALRTSIEIASHHFDAEREVQGRYREIVKKYKS